MKKVISIICLVTFICTVSFTAAWAAEKKESVAVPTAKEKAEIDKKVDLFYKVVAYGEAQKNPIILISAVKLFDDLGFIDIAKPGQNAKGTDVYNRLALLDQAKLYAANDTELLAVIDKVQNPPEEVAVRGHGGGYRGHGGHGGYYGGGHHGGHWGGHYRGHGGWR